MESNGDGASQIRREIEVLKEEKARIEQKILVLEAQLQEEVSLAPQKQQQNESVFNGCRPSLSAVDANLANGLTADSVYRYSRHLLLPSFGVLAQSNLLKSSILVVGAGGLGSPALLYLAACGVGRLGIVDHDVVGLNNMHRQVIHTEAYIGQPKVKSAAAACRSINSTIQIVEHQQALSTSNALEILSQYDIVVDATDNAPSRYMINDCCVVLGKPLVSGAALGLEGQLTVYNYKKGPCYRCLFPTPPPTTACQRCSDSGVLGVALEAIKIASDVGELLSGRMLLFDALSARFRIKSKSPPKLKLLAPDSRITSKEYKERIVTGEPHVLVDVRPEHHYKIVSIPKSLNIPLLSLEARLPEISSALKEKEQEGGANLYIICRRGNDSQRAVEHLRDMGFNLAKDIVGGLESWANDVDPNFPMY